MITDKIQEKRLSKLITLLLNGGPSCQFFGYHCAAHKRVMTRDYPTMATDSVTLYVNPDFMAERTDEHLLFVLAHEGFHRAGLHSIRMREALRAQRELVHMSKDYAVNLALTLDPGFPYRCPDEGLLDRRFTEDDGRATHSEKIFEMLWQEAQQEMQCSQDSGDSESDQSDSGDSDKSDDTSQDYGSTAGESGAETNQSGETGNAGNSGQVNADDKAAMEAMGELLPAPDDTEDECLADDIARDNVNIEAVIQRSGGEVPGFIKELIKDSITTAKQYWPDQVRAELCRITDRSNYTRSIADRRYAHFGLLNPVLRAPAVRRIMVAVDTSGSMSCEMLNEAANQLAVIASEFSPQEMVFVQHDHAIRLTETIYGGQRPTAVDWIGRGGTSFEPVLKLADEMQPDAILWVTDCMPCDRPTEPDNGMPVIFLNVAGQSGQWAYKRWLNFGTLINIED